jgi:hypothetical protein
MLTLAALQVSYSASVVEQRGQHPFHNPAAEALDAPLMISATLRASSEDVTVGSPLK